MLLYPLKTKTTMKMKMTMKTKQMIKKSSYARLNDNNNGKWNEVDAMDFFLFQSWSFLFIFSTASSNISHAFFYTFSFFMWNRLSSSVNIHIYVLCIPFHSGEWLSKWVIVICAQLLRKFTIECDKITFLLRRFYLLIFLFVE